MKKYFILLILYGLLFSNCIPNSESSSQKNKSKITSGEKEISEEKGFAVVELFTSEGCSSCPPADRVANALAEEADQKGKKVFVLAYHVDYWNRLGWTDRFSSPVFTQRQYWYAEKNFASEVYTPQMIVNGKEQFVGSRKETAVAAIQKAFKKTENYAWQLHLKKSPENDKWSFTYEIEGNPGACSLNFVLIEKNLSSDVKAGENRGEKLFHYSLVRHFEKIDLPASKGTVKFKENNIPQKDTYILIAFLQKNDTLEIITAQQLKIE